MRGFLTYILKGIEKRCSYLECEMGRHGQESKFLWVSKSFKKKVSEEHLLEYLILAFLLGLPACQPGFVGDFQECPYEQRYLIDALVNYLQSFLHYH